MQSHARVPTDKSATYMKQLCRHFGHRVRTDWTDESGRIEFDFGVCELRAEPDALVLAGTADDDESVTRLENVVGSHLERFAHREELHVSWSRADS
jgi:uncharacterized protein